ncbi:MAG: hypothetical protein IK100_07240 [Muribaculaceae bacterium]|nr:hypothetical protein [Muribaculaceae bacterium]
MKKYASLLLLLIAVVLLPSCEEDIEKRQVVFTATMPSDDLSSSRLGSIINGVPAADGFNLNAQWKEGDKIQIFVRQDGKVYQLESPAAISDISSDGKTCSFMVTLPKSVNRNKDYDIIGVTGVEANIDGENVIALCNMMRVGTERFNEILPMWFTAKKGSTQAKFRHLCTYEVLNVNNVSDASITFRHSGFKALSRWYIYSASILLSDGSIVGDQDVKNDAESDEITIPAGGTGTIVSWYIPVTIVADVTIDNAKLKAVVNGKDVTSIDAMISYKTQARGNAYYMEVNWDGSTLYFSNEFCPDGNHPHIIDLGLPSGTKWACCNLGANIPTEGGDFYAWGEIATKPYFAKYNYKWYISGDDHNITKYCGNSSFGTVDNRIELEPEDDAAYVNWGPDWRIPSLAQFYELRNNSTAKWTSVNGTGGFLFKSTTNGKAVFLPAAGFPYNGIQDVGSNGFYWTRRYNYDVRPDLGYMFRIHSGGALMGYYYNRHFGASVRAVYVGQE